MALTAEEQKFFDWAVASLPRHYFAIERAEELANAFAKIFGLAESFRTEEFQQALVDTATLIPPDYLGLHAIDRGTSRRDGETDVVLRDRLKNVPDALTVSAVISAAQSLVDAAGIVGVVAMVQLRADKAFMGTFVSDTGTGGSFAVSGSVVSFTPDTVFASPPKVGEALVVSSATSAGNNGSFIVAGLDGNAVVYVNGAGVAEADLAAVWSVGKNDNLGVPVDGFKQSYLSRGFRMGLAGSPFTPTIVIILPFGCAEPLRQSVLETMRLKAGAGVVVRAECRLVP